MRFTGNQPRKGARRRRSGRQDEIHMPGVRPERLGESEAMLICGSCYEDGERDILSMLAETGDQADRPVRQVRNNSLWPVRGFDAVRG